MSQSRKVFIRATSPVGLPTYSRAGRHWPTDKAMEVEVVDQDEDPKGEDGNPHPGRLSKARFAELEKDGRISIRQTAASDENLSKENADLRQRIAELEGQLKQGGGGTEIHAARAGESDEARKHRK